MFVINFFALAHFPLGEFLGCMVVIEMPGMYSQIGLLKKTIANEKLSMNFQETYSSIP